ncbi:hypothetical protein F4804DRAFT_316599 [Jackrogersella minutella]|nr:hypothetical protein F4804DRAFT_316599 [Jackrogersella minutella]
MTTTVCLFQIVLVLLATLSNPVMMMMMMMILFTSEGCKYYIGSNYIDSIYGALDVTRYRQLLGRISTTPVTVPVPVEVERISPTPLLCLSTGLCQWSIRSGRQPVSSHLLTYIAV